MAVRVRFLLLYGVVFLSEEQRVETGCISKIKKITVQLYVHALLQINKLQEVFLCLILVLKT